MTIKGGTGQACAACKYQRRKCSSDCLLSPYFPPDQPRMFQNARKLFGVSNMQNLLKNLDPAKRDEAMRSVIFEANIRDSYPVHGCWGVICQLHFQIRQAEEELQAVYAHVEMYKAQLHQNNHHHHHHQGLAAEDHDHDVLLPSQLELGMAPPHQPCFQQNSYTISSSDNNNNNNIGYSSSNNYLDSNDDDNIVGNNPVWVEQQHPYATNNTTCSDYPLPIQSHQFVPSQSFPAQKEVQDHYDDDLYPFFDTIDDRQSYIETKEPCDSSSEVSLKDNTQFTEHVGENELKSAAACFTLTSVN